MGPQWLLFVNCKLNVVLIRALVDLGVRHIFLVAREARRLNLKLSTATNRVKTINTAVTTMAGLSKGVTTRVGQCEQLDFLVLQIDNFDAILGADFVVKVNVGIFLYCHILIIYGGE